MPSRKIDDAIRSSARLEALRRLKLLDSPPNVVFDRLTRLVRQVLQTPVALLTLVEDDRQFFLSESGLPEPWASMRETPLSHSFCQRVVTTGITLRVDSAPDDPTFRDNPAIRDIGVIAYLGVPLLTSDGHVVGALCAIDQEQRVWTAEQESALTDLASMATNELALRSLAMELEERVRHETAARIAAQEELAQKRRLEALGQLAGGVAHDFANVLQTVQAGVRLAERAFDSDPDKAKRMLDAIGEAARRGGSVTRRLLGFARRGQLRVEQIEPAGLLADLKEVLTHTLGRPGLEIVVDTEADVPPVLADRGELEAVLVNLATNARDALPKGGRLTLSAALDVVETSHPAGLGAGRYIRLAASDNGIGMSAETLARAAEPFFTTKDQGEGTGLGLGMARDFASQAGGGFEITSEVGVGTTVTLWLPAADSQAVI